MAAIVRTGEEAAGTFESADATADAAVRLLHAIKDELAERPEPLTADLTALAALTAARVRSGDEASRTPRSSQETARAAIDQIDAIETVFRIR